MKKIIIRKRDFFNPGIRAAIVILLLLAAAFPVSPLTGQTKAEMFFRGLRSGQQGDLRSAELHFKNTLATDPFYIPARRALDVIKDSRMGMVDKETAAVIFNGMEYYRRGEWPSAVDEFKEAVKKAPSYYLAHHDLGAAYFQDGRYPESIAQSKKAIKLNPRYPYTHNNLGLAYNGEKKPHKAIPHFKRAIRLDPTYYKAYNNLGVAYGMIEKYSEAKAMFSKSVKVNPNYTLGYRNTLYKFKKMDEDETESQEIDTARSLSLEELLKQIEKGDWRERKIAIRVLSIRGNSKTIQAMLKFLRHPDSLVRTTAAKILGDMKAGAAVDALINHLDDKDWSVREEIVQSLGKIRDPRALDSLHRCLLEDIACHVRTSAAIALYYIHDPRSIQPLDKALQDRIPEVREVVIWVLANGFDRNGYYKSLLKEHQEKAAAEPERASASLQGEQQPVDPGDLFLKGDWDRLSRMGEPAVDFLVELIAKGDSQKSVDAILVLGYMENEKAVDALIEQLQSDNTDICFYAAEALGKTSSMKAVPALIELLSHSHWRVKGQAAESLRGITNVFLGDEPEEWRRWWQENK